MCGSLILEYQISEALHCEIEFPSIKRFLKTWVIFLTKTQLRRYIKVFLLRGYTCTIMKVSSVVCLLDFASSSPLRCKSQGLMVIQSM